MGSTQAASQARQEGVWLQHRKQERAIAELGGSQVTFVTSGLSQTGRVVGAAGVESGSPVWRIPACEAVFNTGVCDVLGMLEP
eukprot:1342635-Amphidinium_carterae.1